MTKISTPRGTQDILPEDWPHWTFVIDRAVETALLYGYRRIETPILGQTGLFARATGEGTDIVDKEMYSFRDRGGDELSLRPEGTAPVMRAYLQHGMHKLPQPVKLFYIERMFRYDRPQRGRFREHRQFGCEAIGSDDAYVDVEMISLLSHFYGRIGLTGLTLYLNSIGDSKCRPQYLQALVAYLRRHESALADQDRDRLGRNPLRVLDSKEKSTQLVIEGAPAMLDYLCDACRTHWNKLVHGLEVLGIGFVLSHRLVRGLDYYTRTVFEFVPPTEGSQSTVGAGGRYDGLSEALGGPHVPGIGFGSGIERLVLTVRDQGVQVPAPGHPRVYVSHLGEKTEDEALFEAERLRRQGIPAVMAFGSRSVGAQIKHAAALHAEYAVIIGEDELRDGKVTLRDLESKEQMQVPRGNVEDLIKSGRPASA